MPVFTALLDACVLYPAPLRDLLMHLAGTGLFHARWSDDIHEEWIRSLVADGRDRGRLERTRALMNGAVPDCLVTGYEKLIPGLVLPDPDDRHVLAAAIVGGADVIVTCNVKDFPADALAPYGIEAQHPDDFVMSQFDLSAPTVCEAVKQQRANLRNPPYSVDEFLATLARQQLPRTVARLREFAGLI
jgi:hypothetical protein